MKKDRKIDLLYRKAKGQGWNHASQAEIQELRKYKVDADDGYYATKANISAYVSDVDRGRWNHSFYDWCRENKKADRRRTGSGEAEMAQFNNAQNKSVIFIGGFIWGIALYWLMGESASVVGCLVMGALIALGLFKISRKRVAFTVVGLPIILAAALYMLRK